MAYELLTKEELEKIKPDDITKHYLNEIGKYPLLSNDEFLMHFSEYKKGNVRAKEVLINSNLRLVVFVAKKFVFNTKSFTLLDLVQEGTIGLMKSFENYDPSIGAFSTYAHEYITGYIKRALYIKDEQIRKSSEFICIKNKYKKLLKEYYKINNMKPSDEYVKEELMITDSTLQILKFEKNLDVTSYNKIFEMDDSESDELIDFIGEEDSDFEKIEVQNESFNYLTVIQGLLNKKEYYILNERLIEGRLLKDIADEFNLTGERIRTYETRIIEKILPFIKKENIEYEEILNAVIKKHGNMYYKLKTTPIYPNDICIFLYLKDKLNDIEQQILYYRLLDIYNYEYSDLKNILEISKEEYDEINFKLSMMIEKEKNSESFKIFALEQKNKYGTDLYELQLSDNLYVDSEIFNKRNFHNRLKRLEVYYEDEELKEERQKLINECLVLN